MQPPRIHPSILNADQMHLADELDRVRGADGLHLDVMDNHFVPNQFGGPSLAAAVVAGTELEVDAHLMIEDPDRWAPQYAEAGCSTVTAHIEALRAPHVLVRELHRVGSRAGIALRPATPLDAVTSVLGEVDMLLIMTVEPGFGGQELLEPMLAKVSQARRLLSERDLQVRLQVDGGVSAATIERAAQAGADVFVAGSAVYRAQDAQAAIDGLRAQAAAHRHPAARL